MAVSALSRSSRRAAARSQLSKRPLGGGVLGSTAEGVDRLNTALVRPPSSRRPGTPFIVGVAGGTASGKTAVVARIVEELNEGGSVAVLPQDCFYRTLTKAEVAQAHASNFNFDHPAAFDFDRIVSALRHVRSGSDGGSFDGHPLTLSVPTYDYATHAVLGKEHDTVVAAPSLVIFEGILAFHDPEVMAMLDMKVFVDADADTRLTRRIRRDIHERGRDLEGTLRQYERCVPSFFL
jgi:uridine kinase